MTGPESLYLKTFLIKRGIQQVLKGSILSISYKNNYFHVILDQTRKRFLTVSELNEYLRYVLTHAKDTKKLKSLKKDLKNWF